MAPPKKYPDELRARAVRLYWESDPKPTIRRLAEQLGVHPEALRNWIRQDQVDRGKRVDRPTSDLVEENRRLRKEVAELRRENEILRAASRYFASELTRPGAANVPARPDGGTGRPAPARSIIPSTESKADSPAPWPSGR